MWQQEEFTDDQLTLSDKKLEGRMCPFLKRNCFSRCALFVPAKQVRAKQVNLAERNRRQDGYKIYPAHCGLSRRNK